MKGTHQAAVCVALSGPDGVEIRDVPRAPVTEGMVRIAVRAAGVNFPDYLLTKGQYQLKLDPPFTPGMEVAGIVVEIGEGVTHFARGDRVIALTKIGGYAEEAVVTQENVFALPDVFSLEQGACFVVPMRTAYHALIDRAVLVTGETALILGATGGVGLAAVQLAKQLGATVIAVGSSDAKLEVARSLGADHVVNSRVSNLVAVVRKLTGSVDVVLDPVGGGLAVQAARLLDWGGRFLIVGFASGEIPSFAANHALIKGYSILGVRAGEAARLDPAGFRISTDALLGWTAKGGLAPHISHTFSLRSAAQALRTLENREVVGRVVITNGVNDAA